MGRGFAGAVKKFSLIEKNTRGLPLWHPRVSTFVRIVSETPLIGTERPLKLEP